MKISGADPAEKFPRGYEEHEINLTLRWGQLRDNLFITIFSPQSTARFYVLNDGGLKQYTIHKYVSRFFPVAAFTDSSRAGFFFKWLRVRVVSGRVKSMTAAAGIDFGRREQDNALLSCLEAACGRRPHIPCPEHPPHSYLPLWIPIRPWNSCPPRALPS